MRRTARYFTIGFIALILSMSGLSGLRSEHVFLKDGSIVSGTIVVDAAKSLTVKNTEGKRETIARDRIMRILYTELYMGKVFIRMNDGTVKSGYLVDEDQKTYTFRKELYKIDEFTVQREKVLFIARTNPTDLAGEADTDEIDLKWSPPFQPPKRYKVYLKSKAFDFKVARETRGTGCAVGDLTSNTKYWVKVSALDSEGNESLPSNMIEVTTKNIPPKRPGSLSLAKIPTEKGVSLTKTLTWGASADPDGTVKEYRIYRKTGKEYERIGATPALHFDLPSGVVPDALSVRAVDDRGDESEGSNFWAPQWLHVRVDGLLLFPSGDLQDLYTCGTGATAGIYITDMLFANSVFGLDAGYVYWSGGTRVVDYMHMVPVTAWAGYRIGLMDNLSLVPSLHTGFAYMYTKYSGRGESGVELLSITRRDGVDVIAGAGLDLHFMRGDGAFFQAGMVFTFIIETPSPFMYAGLRIGGGLSW